MAAGGGSEHTKTWKYEWTGLHHAKSWQYNWIGKKLSFSYSYKNVLGLSKKGVMVSKMGVHHSARFYDNAINLFSFFACTCLMSLAFVAADSQTSILVILFRFFLP